MSREADKMEIMKLKKENKAWKETCEILADKTILQDIDKSLKEIKKGRCIPLSEL